MEKIPNIMNQFEEPKESLKTIIALAQENTDEAWEEIDEKIKGETNNEIFVDWAKENLNNQDSGLSDLAATILEATDLEIQEEDINSLMSLMRQQNEENPYPSFRAACALAKRFRTIEPSILSEVKEKLQSFLEDDDVSDIAKRYLEELP